MVIKTFRTRAAQLAGGIALCSLAAVAQADPFNLQGNCVLTSIVAGQGRCQMHYTVGDDYLAAADIRTANIRIDGIYVARYVNDSTNPATGTVPYLSGFVEVGCGVSHVVTAYVVKLGVGMPQIKIGNLPAVLCPTAP
jgi:hypothetical protein